MRTSQKFDTNSNLHEHYAKNKKKLSHNTDTMFHANIMKTRLHDIPICNFLSDFCMILHNFMREIEIP